MSNYTPPTATAGDLAHTVIRAGLGSIPVVGDAAIGLFQAIIAPPLEHRRIEWMQRIALGLEALEVKQKCIVDDLKANDAFIDTVMQASQAALRTSQQVKLDALRNAVLNSALPSAPDDTRRQLFINWVDTLTVWHLRMLKLFVDPRAWYANAERQGPPFVITGSLAQLLTDAYPELKNERELYDKLGKDLYQDGLAGTNNLHSGMSGDGPYEKRTTALGDQLMSFIADPLTK